MLEKIITILKDNPLITTLMAFIASTGITGFIFTKVAVFIMRKLKDKLINDLLSQKNQTKIAEALDEKIDHIQKQNKEIGKEAREDAIKAMQRLRETANECVAKLKEDDGCN
jgi:F0F1-type ATP synthase membrane subunit b/b'